MTRKMLDPHGIEHDENTQCKYSGCKPIVELDKNLPVQLELSFEDYLEV